MSYRDLPKFITRIQVAIGLVICIALGYWFWTATSGFFIDLADLPEVPVDPPPPATLSQTIWVFLAFIGMVFWPGVMAGIWFLFVYFWNKRVRAAQWENETILRNAREAETERKIAAAKAKGLIK